MNTLYPLKFDPLFKNKPWGGNKMRTLFHMNYDPLPNCGEAWALSGLENNESVVSNGFLAGNSLTELIEVYMDELVGESVYAKNGLHFPLLFKWIDSREKLSLQVHPDDEMAAKNHAANGKTEMWYVVQADEQAQIISGFNRKISSLEYAKRLREKTLLEVLHVEDAAAGDVFFIPGGRVHALCEGILLAEIQQSSDTTFRIYDWDRLDAQGQPRPLHLADAMHAIDFDHNVGSIKQPYRNQWNQSTPLVDVSPFTTQLMHLNEGLAKDYSALDSFVVYLCAAGKATVHAAEMAVPIAAGECLLLPATTQQATIYPEKTVTLLETFIRC